ncbi:MAG TPA: hypothetical protein VIU12_23675 [Chryseolinea sp.]
MTKKIIIPYFPVGLKLVSPILFFAGLYLVVIGHPLWGVVLILLTAIILTTRYVTSIDLQKKVCDDYLSMLGIPFSKETKKFNALDRIVITKGNYAQRVQSRIQSRDMNWSDYTATLVFDDGGTLDLVTRNDKKELLLGVKEFADFLKVGVEDHSTSHHYWVDFSQVVKE